MTRSRPQRRKWRSLYIWHRTLGLIAVVLVIVLSLTGIGLNHGNQLALDQRFISCSWLLKLYPVSNPPTPMSYDTEAGRVTQLGQRLYLGERFVLKTEQALIGAVRLPDLLVIALDASVVLTTPDGEILEHQSLTSGLPEQLLAIGKAPSGQIIVLGAQGPLTPDADFLNWSPVSETQPEWSSATVVPEALKSRLDTDYRSHFITWERLLFDLHSGRLFGAAGVWLLDLAGVLLLFLAFSGTRIWYKQRRKHS